MVGDIIMYGGRTFVDTGLIDRRYYEDPKLGGALKCVELFFEEPPKGVDYIRIPRGVIFKHLECFFRFRRFYWGHRKTLLKNRTGVRMHSAYFPFMFASGRY